MEQYLTVSALTKYLKYKFDNDTHLKNVYLKGEVSNFKHHSRGHFYFTIKDETSQINAIMFARSASKIKFKVKDGMKVMVTGYISVYEASGQYQIYCNDLIEDGVGALYLAYEELKEKLAKEGLFDPLHKKKIPEYPKAVGVITSPTGAAVRDIINVISRRYPLAKIIIYPALVQGEFAKDSIVNMIEQANTDAKVDVLIVGRGGGSIEDLWGFNEESVAYAVYESNIPIISAVGHETDFTIIDFVSDLRAPTPSGAAELAVPDKKSLLEYVSQLKQVAYQHTSNHISQNQLVIAKLRDNRVFTQTDRLFETKEYKVDTLSAKLEQYNPINKLNTLQETLKSVHQAMQSSFIQKTQRLEYRYANAFEKLAVLSPYNLMNSGYSIIKKNGNVITTTKLVEPNDTLDVLMSDGSLKVSVLEKEESSDG